MINVTPVFKMSSIVFQETSERKINLRILLSYVYKKKKQKNRGNPLKSLEMNVNSNMQVKLYFLFFCKNISIKRTTITFLILFSLQSKQTRRSSPRNKKVITYSNSDVILSHKNVIPIFTKKFIIIKEKSKNFYLILYSLHLFDVQLLTILHPPPVTCSTVIYLPLQLAISVLICPTVLSINRFRFLTGLTL
ncbi:hypothetical protein PUN28_004323 [Cardiocondyla obscurior]|uniref:Uncharacterized protein n=1 Tax=Cardiocondyla obscurior TaxID=286306 RepID=A0AAW2GA56_9HYME